MKGAASRVYLICGCVFGAVGLIFLVVGGLVLANLEALAATGQGDVRLLPPIFGGLGALMLAAGVLFIALLVRAKRKIKRLVERGEYVTADIVGFPVDYRVTINGRPTYCVECSYRDPATGVVHVFRSRGLSIDPERYVTAATVRVYVSKESGYRDYYVDIDPILPRVELH